jgi:HAD superfamily hydrolase (TIGR01456 family)
MGAFRIALESIFNRIHEKPLEYTSFGKPNPFVFKNAEDVLKEIATSPYSSNQGSHHFKTLYMIGDNPKIDIRGARQVSYSFSQTRVGHLAIKHSSNLTLNH